MTGFVALWLLAADSSIALDGGTTPTFERITLQQAVDRALQQNISVVTAAEEVRHAEALVEQARSGSLPTLFGNGTYTRLDADRTLGATVIAAQNQLSGSVTLTLPLVAPPRWMQWVRAADQAEVTRASLEDVRRTIAATAARAYLTIMSQRRVVEVNERARDTAKAHLDYSSARLRGGVGTRLDEARAEQEWRTDHATLQNAYTSLARAREALGVILGGNRPLDAMTDAELPAPPSADKALDDARAKRSDLKASERRMRAAESSLAGGWTDYMPLLSAAVTPFYQNPPTLTQPLWGWQAQLILTVPFYDGGLRYGQQHERVALKNEAKEAYDQLLRQTGSEVRVAFEALQRADDALRAAQQASSLAQESLRLTNLAYKTGATTNIEVIDAERRAHDADTQVAIAEDTARQARLELLLASGHFP